jgi:pseudaminic acid cytidylyltransferase
MTVAPATVAIIPARGGSKRVPRKNIRLISGRPIIAWAIALCRDSGAFDDVVVSTDDDEIAAIAEGAGARVPFRRPEGLADDVAPTVDVISHAVTWLERQGQAVDLACCVYPASVFLPSADLRRSRDVLLAHPEAAYVATVVPYPHPVQRALRQADDGTLSFVQPEFASSRTQDLEPLWHDAGQFYWGRADAWRARVPILPHAVGYPVDADRVCDIDTEDDWRRAEVLHALVTGANPVAPDAVG